MKRPILIAVLGYGIGILWGLYFKISIVFPFMLFILILVLVKQIKFHRISNLKRYVKVIFPKKSIFFFIILVILGNMVIEYQNQIYEQRYQQIPNKIETTAVVISNKVEKEYSIQYKIRIITIYSDTRFQDIKVILNLKKTNDNSSFNIGDKIVIKGEYVIPEQQRNTGGFDQRQYLKSIGISGTIQARQVIKIGKEKVGMLEEWPSKVSKSIKEKIQNVIQNEEARQVLLGILLGEKQEIAKEIKSDFKASNLSHLLAVSGMHVSYLLLGITFFFERMFFPKRKIQYLSISFLIFFMYMVGNTPSVQRACIMTVVAIIAKLSHRKSDKINNLAISFGVIMMQNPFTIQDRGFILSFLGTIGILFIYPLLKQKWLKKDSVLLMVTHKTVLEKLYLKIKDIILITMAVQLVILPVSIYYFNTVSFTFLLSSIFVSFLIAPILLLGVICTVLPVASILTILLEILLMIVKIVSSLPGSKILVGTPNILLIISYYVILSFVFYVIKIKNKHQRRIEKTVVKQLNHWLQWGKEHKVRILSILMLMIIIIMILAKIPKEIQIYFIDVGQGDSTLVLTPKGKQILLDGGGNRAEQNFDIGENILIPYLLKKNITQIEYLCISHFDADHVGRFIYCNERIKSEKCGYRKAI